MTTPLTETNHLGNVIAAANYVASHPQTFQAAFEHYRQAGFIPRYADPGIVKNALVRSVAYVQANGQTEGNGRHQAVSPAGLVVATEDDYPFDVDLSLGLEMRPGRGNRTRAGRLLAALLGNTQ